MSMEIKLSRKVGTNGHKLNKIQVQECISRYASGESIIAISKQLNISQNMISAALKRNNVRVHSRNSRHIETFKDKDQLLNDYQNGDSIATLSKRYNLYTKTIKKILITAQVYKAPSNQKIQMAPSHLATAKELALRGVAYKDIGKELGYSVWIVNKSLFAAGIRRKKAERTLSIYQAQVRRLSEKSYNTYKDLINPSGLHRSKGTNHLDHIYSVYDGFINNVPATVLSHPMNLRIIDSYENIVKRAQSDHTLEILLQKIKDFENK